MSVHLQDLRSRPQWAVAADDKVPHDPKTSRRASVADPSTWATYDEARARLNGTFKHAGFVLSDDAPYTVIDLDDKPDKPATADQRERFQRLIDTFDSYTERSSSGRGYHIWVRGKVPSGLHRGHVEVYSSRRFMICTGNVVRDVPIRDAQPLLDSLYREMKGAEAQSEDESLSLRDGPEVMDDANLFEMAMRAENSAKFDALCRGGWQELEYPSQSEADHALLSILCFYTRNNEQVRRLFRYSALGRREKAMKNDVYLNRSIAKIRAAEPPSIDPSALLRPHAASPKPQRRIVLWDEFSRSAGNPLAVVRDLLGENAQSAVYGEPGSGKTFLVLHLGAAISLGRDFFGRPTKKTPVVYFVGEGVPGMKQRVRAVTQQLGGVIPRVAFYPHGLDAPKSIPDILACLDDAAKAFGEPPGLVIFDTLNRYFGARNENSQEDMALYVNVGATLIERFPGVHIAHVHHQGKDPGKKMRGSSALHGALDTEIECTKTLNAQFQARVAKQRDGDENILLPFRLLTVELADADGNPITSCIAEPVSPQQRAVGSTRLYPTDQAAATILREMVGSEGATREAGVDYTEFLGHWRERTGGSKGTSLKNAQHALVRLAKLGVLVWSTRETRILVKPTLFELPGS